MPNANAPQGLKERLTYSAEERLGRALSELLDNPLLTGAIGRAFDARERAAQAQELAMGALNIPSAADIERLTRRLRSISQRLEGIEDAIHRLDRPPATQSVEARLEGIEQQLKELTGLVAQRHDQPATQKRASATKRSSAKPKTAG
ncbi:MAG TPA: hypothetical protein VIC05_00480 [Solirubrobacteraceae bacterium]|jgi:hypothetical protein